MKENYRICTYGEDNLFKDYNSEKVKKEIEEFLNSESEIYFKYYISDLLFPEAFKSKISVD